MRKKTCPICREKFTPVRAIQPTCWNFDCMVKHAEKVAEKSKAAREKRDRAETKVRKEKIKSRADWSRDAQQALNAWVRARDEKEPCISCGRYHEGQYHAGHFLSRGAHPALAFEPLNLAKQCQPCNTHLSGNQLNFRKGLIERIGLEKVEWLEGPHEPRKYSIDDLKGIIKKYRAKLREIKGKA